MKKLSFKQLTYWLRRRQIHERRRYARLLKRHSKKSWFSSRKEIHLPLPESFSLSDHYDEVMDFVDEFRRTSIGRRRLIYVDFRTLRDIGAAGAVLLAAEMDRWRRVAGVKLLVRDLPQWDPEICCLLNELGLFDVLKVHNPPDLPHLDQDRLRFIQFRSGTKAEGDDALELRKTIEEFTGPLRDSERTPLFRALTEAMNNVVQHAYPDDGPYQTKPLRQRWWMAGAFLPKERKLMIVFYDQGVGIPITLPRVHTIEKISGVLSSLGLGDDDAARIQASFKLGSSRTGLAHRGGGLLRDIRKLTELTEDGVLRILSGRGEYIYDHTGTAGEPTVRLVRHRKPLGGTLIQWFVTVPEGR